jgi:hypothetical protein
MHRMVDIAVAIAEQLGKDARLAARGAARRGATPPSTPSTPQVP